MGCCRLCDVRTFGKTKYERENKLLINHKAGNSLCLRLGAVKNKTMGLYMYINAQDRIKMRNLKDSSVKEIFDEAREFDPTLMISELVTYERSGIFSKKKEVSSYSIYHEVFLQNGNPAYEARQQLSASGSKEVVMAYLFGIINGGRSERRHRIRTDFD